MMSGSNGTFVSLSIQFLIGKVQKYRPNRYVSTHRRVPFTTLGELVIK